MKFLLLFFFLSAGIAAVCGIPYEKTDGKIGTKVLLLRQKNILKLLNHVHMPIFHDDFLMTLKTFDIYAHKLMWKKIDVVEDFYRFYKKSTWLPKGKIFSIGIDTHKEQAILLFHLFYYANDFDTFFKTAIWAREHINEGMFVYAFTVALLHREDCKGFILPAPYEIYPYFFLNTDVIQKGMRAKLQEKLFVPTHAKRQGVHMDGNVVVVESNYSGWYLTTNEEQKLSYFMEDIGLNSYYYYFHMDYPFWMRGKEFGLMSNRRGEIFYYFYQQLLARFYMERLSNGMGKIPRFTWRRTIKTGFVSNLRYFNGFEFPSRPNAYDLETSKNYHLLDLIEDCERRIRDAVFKGYVTTEDGTVYSLKKAEDINRLGNIIQGNVDSVNNRFYRYMGLIAKTLLGNSVMPHNELNVGPSVLEQFETSLRDPMFYQLYKRVMTYFFQFKDMLPFYRRMELDFKGVKVDNVFVDKLITYFDFFDVDMTTAFAKNIEEMKVKDDRLIFIARQKRLNHAPFDVKIDVTSDKSTDVMVKIFLGPKIDFMRRKIHINENRRNFFEMDTFLYKLKIGKNVIVRNSREFLMTVKDRTMTRRLMRVIDGALEGGEQFIFDNTESHFGFPDRLLLPVGKMGGMMFQMFVMVMPAKMNADIDKTMYTDMNLGSLHKIGSGWNKFMYDYALGYPFDRRIVETEFYTPNMFFKDVMIHHTTDILIRDKDTEVLDKDTVYKNVDVKDFIMDKVDTLDKMNNMQY